MPTTEKYPAQSSPPSSGLVTQRARLCVPLSGWNVTVTLYPPLSASSSTDPNVAAAAQQQTSTKSTACDLLMKLQRLFDEISIDDNSLSELVDKSDEHRPMTIVTTATVSTQCNIDDVKQATQNFCNQPSAEDKSRNCGLQSDKDCSSTLIRDLRDELMPDANELLPSFDVISKADRLVISRKPLLTELSANEVTSLSDIIRDADRRIGDMKVEQMMNSDDTIHAVLDIYINKNAV
jgi:hypothetical protein